VGNPNQSGSGKLLGTNKRLPKLAKVRHSPPGTNPDHRRQISPRRSKTARMPGAAFSIGRISLSNSPESESGAGGVHAALFFGEWPPRIGFGAVARLLKPAFRAANDRCLTPFPVQPVGDCLRCLRLTAPTAKRQRPSPLGPLTLYVRDRDPILCCTAPESPYSSISLHILRFLTPAVLDLDAQPSPS